MPGRQSHGGAPSKVPRVRTKSKQRTLDAFSIASHQHPDKIKIRQHRLGISEGGNRPNKRRRDDNNEEDEEEEQDSKKRRKSLPKGRFDELDLDEGSDSEGNEWKMGQVDSDDDSDLDSDEAFGESDEERFEGFAFSGSSDKKIKKKPVSKPRDVNLDEDSAGEDSGSELEEGDLGDDAVDLADMFDASEDEDEVMGDEQQAGDESGSEEENDASESSDDESAASSIDEEEASDPAKLAALQRLVTNLPQTDNSSRGPAKQRSDGASEYNKPSDFGLTSKTKLTLEDLGLPGIKDAQIKKSLKFLGPEEESKRKGVSKRLEVPLAKRQQDRLDRSAAYDKSKETLSRWTDTVKHNRRADHLIFPLPDNDTTSAQANSRLQPNTHVKPFNELEATIQSILEESGLATANGKDDEDHIREFEELETNKMSLKEVKERRDQLRMARELLFREEAKSKRIKKIKSKSYRKVHRKQREKEERLNKEALAEGGFVPSEDELEAQDRRRATERMGQRHRGSKWAKATKNTGRAAWDEDARAGISEMARRDEELRKRVEGRAVRKEFEDESDESSFDDEDNDLSEDDETAERKRLIIRLDGVSGEDLEDDSAPGSKLANMKFMRKAEASKRKENDAAVEDIRRELAGEDPSSEEEDVDIGRRIFGPGSNNAQENKSTSKLNEFEEPLDSEDDGLNEPQINGLDNDSKASARGSKSLKPKKAINAPEISYPKMQPQSTSEGGAWSKVTTKSSFINDAEAKRRRHKSNNAIDIDELDLTKASLTATRQKTKKIAKKSSTLQVSSDDESGDENAVQLPFAIRDQELIKKAFAGQDVVGEFETEKRQTIIDDDEKIIDNTLPGWGSWTGDGISKREKARNKGRFLTKSEGIKEQHRKDAKLERVIINEKRVKKASTHSITLRDLLTFLAEW
jgi:U3 small nucleolar RNA-associated protein 14